MSNALLAFNSSQVTISGGWVAYLYANNSSRVTMSGGAVGFNLQAHDSSQITISGGSVRYFTGEGDLDAYNSSQLTMRGGTIGQNISLRNEAILTIYGSDFSIDGNPFGYGEITSLIGADIVYEPYRRLTGTLASGEIIDNDFRIGHTAKIVLIYEPVGIPEPICTAYPTMDFNKDCKVDFQDFAIFTQSWLECNLDPPSACWE